MTTDQIDNIFTYHAPFGTQQDRYVAIRDKAKELALLVNEACPESREKSLALTNLQQSVQMANASIAIVRDRQGIDIMQQRAEAAEQALARVREALKDIAEAECDNRCDDFSAYIKRTAKAALGSPDPQPAQGEKA